VKSEKKELGEYRQELQQLPARIQASGLGQTLAFYASRPSSAVHVAVGNQLATFLAGEGSATAVQLLTAVMSRDVASYRRLTREALAYAEWLKRYAAALIEKPKREG
jgi:CRISPR-associated protein Cmr5